MIVTNMPDADLSDRSILVVEDEFYLAIELQDEIERVGGTVVGPAADRADAMTAIGPGGIDFALIDINLGDGPSFDLADTLAAADVPFAFLTGYDPAAIPDRFAGVERLQKPASIAALLRVIERHPVG